MTGKQVPMCLLRNNIPGVPKKERNPENKSHLLPVQPKPEQEKKQQVYAGTCLGTSKNITYSWCVHVCTALTTKAIFTLHFKTKTRK